MAQFTEEKFEAAINAIKTALGDGFDIGDLAVIVEEITVFADLFEMTGAEKKALALRLAERILAETDFPYLPDKLSLPFVGEVGADALFMRIVPKLIDLVVKGSSGELAINRSEGGEDAPG